MKVKSAGKTEWEYVGITKSKDQASMIYALNKTTKLKNGNIRTWVKLVPAAIYKADNKEPEKLLECTTCPYQLFLLESDCDNQRIKIVSYLQYSYEGKVIESDDREGTWFQPAPNSMGDAILGLSCNG